MSVAETTEPNMRFVTTLLSPFTILKQYLKNVEYCLWKNVNNISQKNSLRMIGISKNGVEINVEAKCSRNGRLVKESIE